MFHPDPSPRLVRRTEESYRTPYLPPVPQVCTWVCAQCGHTVRVAPNGFTANVHAEVTRHQARLHVARVHGGL